MEDEQQQIRYLDDALKILKQNGFLMKRALDGHNMKVALDHMTEILRELRTNILTAKNYYELYMKVLDELRWLEEYLVSLHESGNMPISSIYEQVQTCANVVPRMYLLCCVGGVYIHSKEAPAKEILRDLIELIKGVQHPMRGLFLRNYLTLTSKNRLPDVGSPYEGIGGSIEDAYNFLLQNFVETNRLWVRLQNQGAAKDKDKRKKERKDLCILVGANLVRISQLEGLDIDKYRDHVLPKILEEVNGCKDTIAQTYLMDCIIQVFPDDFHLGTLETLLTACTLLKEKVNVRLILESLMERLAAHAASGGVTSSVDNSSTNSFKLFNDCITTLIESRANMSLTETLRLQTVLTNFALKCHANRRDYVSHCLSTSGALIEKTDFLDTSKAEGDNPSKEISETTDQIELLLSSPLSSISLGVLEIPAYGTLMSYLPWNNWKKVAVTLLKSIISFNSPLNDVKQTEQIFKMITPLLRDQDVTAGKGSSEEEEAEEINSLSSTFRAEQYLVARIPHLMKNSDTDVMLQLLQSARTAFVTGGAKRMQFTFPPLVFAAISLSRRVQQREKEAAEEDAEETPPKYSTRKVFLFVMEVITALATAHPEAAMKLFLQAAQATDEFGFHSIAYEFVKEALLIYESDITDSKLQVTMLTLTIGSLLKCNSFPHEDYEALITKIAQYAGKLLKKPDQCRMVSLCSHLFWPPNKTGGYNVATKDTTKDSEEKPKEEEEGSASSTTTYSDNHRLLECMQRSLKVASVGNPNLFVDILDRYVYFYENNNPIIQVKYLSGLIGLINEQRSGAEPLNPAVEAHYKNTLEYIRSRQASPETAEKFKAILLSGF